MDIQKKRIILYLCSLLFLVYIFSVFIFSSLINNMFDKQNENGNFKFGEACYHSLKPYSRKSTGSYVDMTSYFFLIDGLKSKNLVRPYFPFKNQFDNFINNLDRTRCYKVKYLEVKILFYKQRRIYELINFN